MLQRFNCFKGPNIYKALKVMTNSRKMKTMKTLKVPIRREIIEFLKDIKPRKIESPRELCVLEHRPCNIKMLPITTKRVYSATEPCSSVVVQPRNRPFKSYRSFKICPSSSDTSDDESSDTNDVSDLFDNVVRPQSEYIKDLTREGIEPNPGPNTKNNMAPVPRRRPRRRNNNNRRRRNNQAATSPIHIQQIMPMKKIATLTYVDRSTVRNNAGGNFLVYSMRINDLYDPDPLILSGSISNFKEIMQFYGYYRVLSTRINWSVINLENFPLNAGIVFSQSNLTGVIASASDAQDAFENDFCSRIFSISSKGGMDRVTVALPPLRISRLLGVGTQYLSDIAYAGSGLATPTIPLWANFIVWSPTGGTLTNGYANSTTLAMRSEFFGRINVRA
jgi:hypothetical protein